LQKLGLSTLEKRRIRGDHTGTFKIVNGMENVVMNQFFEFSDTDYNLAYRGHEKKLAVKGSRLDTRKLFLGNGVVRH